MKTVYHGTTLERANRIVEGKAIEVTNENNLRYSDTVFGYVYVSTILQNALDFSVRPCISEDTSMFAVFKFAINDNEMQIDYDEEKWGSFVFKGDEHCCFRISRNIDLINDDVEWLVVRKDDNSYKGDFKDYLNYVAKEIQESEWSKWHD